LNNIKNITKKNIFVLGRSLGTGPAIYLASKRSPAATFLISPYTTFAAVGKHSKEEDFLSLLNHFRSIDYVEQIKSPLLFIHGKIDQLIKYNESIKLYEKCSKDIIKEIDLIDEIGHNFYLTDWGDKIIPLIKNFINKYGLLNNSEIEQIIIDFDNKFYEIPEEIKKNL